MIQALHEITAAVIFLTRLPVAFPGTMEGDLNARATAWFPLVGAGVGLCGGAVFALATAAGLPPMLAALLALAATVGLTGGLHEDGLADVADGFGGGRDRAHALEIMRDSRVGSYGVLALVFSIALRAAALAALAEPAAVLAALVASGALSRGLLPVVMRGLEPARRDGLAAGHGRPAPVRVALALGLGAAVALAALGTQAPAAIAGALLATALVGRLARRHLGGYTGDVLGTVQQAVEVTVLIVLVGLR